METAGQVVDPAGVYIRGDTAPNTFLCGKSPSAADPVSTAQPDIYTPSIIIS